MKRLSLFCLAAIFSVALWAYDFEDGGIYYNIVDGGVEVTWGGNGEEAGTSSYSEAMTIPNEVEYEGVTYTVVGIGSHAFYGDMITSIELPETVTYIDTYAFYYCYLLESINISAAVTSIGNHAFHFCTHLTDIGTLENVVTIGTYGFYSCSSLTSIETLKRVKSIGSSCFSYCSKLASIDLPLSLTSLGDHMFRECKSLEEITIPYRIKELPGSTLRDCSSLKAVTLPAELGSVGTYCFKGCTALTSITSANPVAPAVSNTNAFTDVDKDSCIIYVPIDSKESYVSATGWQDFGNIVETEITSVIPLDDGDNFQGDDGFYYTCVSGDDLTCEVTWGGEKKTSGTDVYTGAITIPKTTTYQGCTYTVIGLGDSAFRQCEGLTSVVIPNTVTYIGGTYVFSKCSSLIYVEIPESVTFIGDGAFHKCASLKNVTLPNSITTMGSSTFYYCSGLETVSLSENIEELTTSTFRYCTSLKEIAIPEKVTVINNYAFDGCTSLTRVSLSNHITDLGQYTFQNNSSLVDVIAMEDGVALNTSGVHIPDGVNTMKISEFINCVSLEEVTIPAAVVEFKNKVFQNCAKLASVTCLNPEPPVCGTQVFDGIYEESVLYIPVGSYEDYSTADTWRDFFNIVEMVEFSIETLEAKDVTDTSATLIGNVIAAYNEPIIERGFQYWADEDDVQTIASDVIENGAFAVTIDELMYSTTYTYRVYATTENDTTYGDEFTFTTELYAPEVATLAATDVTDTSAVLNGEVEQGSEPINRKGFIFGANSTPNVITIVIVSDEDLTYTLENLQNLTAYTYRAFVTTDSGTVYGEDITFTTAEVDGINGIGSGINSENVEGIYSASGQKLNALQKGINIVKYTDGTTTKVLVK